MLTRYKEGIASGKASTDAVLESVRYAGHTVVLSGVTLILAYMSLLLFDCSFIVAIGKGAVISMAACLTVNITFIPAMLLAFPRLFEKQGFWGPCANSSCCRRRGRADSIDGVGYTEHQEDESVDPLVMDPNESSAGVEVAKLRGKAKYGTVEETAEPQQDGMQGMLWSCLFAHLRACMCHVHRYHAV